VNVLAIDHVEFYVADASTTAANLSRGYGFEIGEGGTTIPLRQHDILMLLTSATPAAEAYVAKHGDGVAVIALRSSDPRGSFDEAVRRGARAIPDQGLTIAGFGDVALRFVADGSRGDGPPGRLREIDHIAICVPAGELASTVAFSETVLGFKPIFSEKIEIGTQAMDSVVVQSPSGAITFTLLEPDQTRQPGQIDEFLRAHDGMGVQHVAFRTDDIAGSVREISSRGVGFLTTPAEYYDALGARLGGEVSVPISTLRELHVLVDRDHGGHLFQIFTRSVHSRRTFFFELIERRGASTFGTANIRALYEAVERQRAVART
jgi:4-hydroxymandelate synthase